MSVIQYAAEKRAGDPTQHCDPLRNYYTSKAIDRDSFAL